jgi:F420-non-reducing hydrogenase iron-sulfur subunit
VNARRRVEYAHKLLEEIGLESKRVEMVNLSAAMGAKFAEIATRYTEDIRQLGPNPLKVTPGSNDEKNLAEAITSE